MPSDSFTLRPATASDEADIKTLIKLVRINPMDLDWRRFLLASTPDGGLAACAQIKPHADGTRELASLAVSPAWRGRGLARRLVEALIAREARPIYLTCRSGLESFYQKFGFRALEKDELTPYYRRLQKLANTMMKLGGGAETLSVMRLDE
ncbi:MAG: GNAT family N-acetyltransferase [Chloroflexi bacterium]|nr:GNAT family N-acetyltransferase [Chloroflexota bacterium]